ncbi:hypothetical protein H2201_001622 [Coniosporium apollinis]|uniref:Ricin B lectin domain-containing protein n=1 Tax=Coniosporium apollinis TaxID=61459 RepID=A0ABQ9P2E5_9PEZI|nr:hypothetical protein H2201_001622 [Coniosporium apollinis]
MTEPTLTEWDALGAYSSYVGAALAAYGKFQEVFGPAKQTVDWNRYIVASERRIIAAIKQEKFKDHTRELKRLSLWWSRDCLDFLKRNPISPQNIQAFETGIGIDVLRDYGTYGFLLLAYTLLYVLLTTEETYFIAVEGKKSGRTIISQTIADGIAAIEAWPDRYFTERATHMSIEVEHKYEGGGGILGRPGEKRFTGWYIVHDAASDPAVASFEGKSFYRLFPKKVQMVTDSYKNSEMATTTVPNLLKEWKDLHAQALRAEAKPLPSPQKPVDPFDVFVSNAWYRLRVFSPPYLAIDVVNDPSTIAIDAQLHLTPESNVSGQFWQLRRSRSSPGSWNLCTLFLGTKMCLDVYGDDKKRPHLAPAGNYSGQQWQITDRRDGSWSLTNAYSGPELLLDVRPDGLGGLCLSDRQEESRTQRWLFLKIRQITEEGF